MYSSPIWGFFAQGSLAEASVAMYAWSTASFVVVAVALAVRPVAAERLLARRSVMIGSGVAASIGVFAEFISCTLGWPVTSPLFAAGAVLTGAGTAFVALRAGEIYAAAAAPVAVTNTALCEVAAGLIFFLVVGTVPDLALGIAALLPLAAAVMVLFDRPARPSERGEAPECSSADDSCESTPPLRRSLGAFVRFMVVVFILTFAVNAARGAMGASAPGAATFNAVGITFVILAAFAIAAASSLVQRFSFSVLYYPLILVLVAGLVIVFSAGVDSAIGSACMVFVFSLFSMFMWCLLAYMARGDFWRPVQVFGWGRAVFALGALAGMMFGPFMVAPSEDPSASVLIGIVLAFIILAAAMLIFRESDVAKIVSDRDAAAAVALAGSISQDAAAGSGPVTAPLAAAIPEGEGADAASARTESAATFAAAHGFTVRECEVFPLMLEGRDARSIGEALFISENTAKAHIRNIYGKVGARNRREFVEATCHVYR